MKTIRNIFIVISIILLASCAAPGSNGSDESVSDIGKELTVTAKSIGTVSPYTYGVVEAKAIDGPSYLSFNTPDSTVFQPLVFESGSGTKVVFENATINQIDEDFYYIDGTLQTIRKEPVVQYKESGEDDAEGNPIMVAATVEIDVIRSYGDNEAILDMRDGSAYLLQNPETFEGIRTLYNGTDHPSIWVTDNYLYMIGNDSDSTALYRIGKDELSKGTLKQLTSDEQGWPERVLAVSDDYVLLKITDDKGYFSPYLLDINSENPASVIIPANYKDDQDNEIGLFEDAGDTYNAFIKGDLLYDFHKKGTDIICNILRIVDGSLLFEDQIVIQSEDSEGWELEKLSSADFSIGLILASHYSSTTMLSDSLIRVNLNGTDVTVDEVVLDANAKTAAHFETVGDRVYWIAGANDNNGSFICYHDFGTDSTVRKPIPGKAAASSELSVSEDGTVVYTQFMDVVDTGTFSWNPDKEEEPTLLMLEEADVHSIVSINKL